MSLKSDLEAAKKRQREAEEIQGSVGKDLSQIAERVLKGETTGNALDDFCIVNRHGESFYRQVDKELGKYQNGLVMLVREEEIQVSCSITHGEFEFRPNFTLGLNISHEWNARTSELLIKGRFAEMTYRNHSYKEAGNELRLDSHTLALAASHYLGGMERYTLLIGKEVNEAVHGKTHFDWHAWSDLKNGFKLIGYKPDKDLRRFADKLG